MSGLHGQIQLGACWILFQSRALHALERLADRVELRRSERGLPSLVRRRGGCVQILTYHRVALRQDEYLPALALATFEREMAYLAANRRVIGLRQAVAALAANDVPNGAVVLTFDDGYRDNRTHVLPVLRRLGLPATVFLTTGAIGTDRLLWYDQVLFAFSRTRRTRLEGVLPSGAPPELEPPERRERARLEVLRRLKTLGEQERELEIERLCGALEVDRPKVQSGLMLDWDDVREMRDGGVEFGSHTVTHPVLSTLPPDRVRREIAESKDRIERELDRQVTTFAYPNGSRRDFDETTKRILRELGISAAVTTIHGSNRAEPDGPGPDLLELKRMGLRAPRLAVFATRLAMERLKAARRPETGPMRRETKREGTPG